MPEMAGAGVFPGYLTGRTQMPTPQREPLRRLSCAERAVLQRIATSRSERVDQVRRATALLAVARTGVFSHAAREAGLHSGTTVADLVARFNRHGLARSEEHTSELQSHHDLVCRLLLEKKNK